MLNHAFVRMWNRRIGAIAWNPNTGLGSFQYDKAFLTSGLDVSPIQMPVRQGDITYSFPALRNNATFKGLPGLLADVLPDKYGNALINTWLTRQGRPSNSLNPVEMLCFIGQRGMGALEFEPIAPPQTQQATPLELASLIEVAEDILSGRKDFSAQLTEGQEKALVETLKIGTSAGGARAKALIAFNENTGEIRSGQTLAPRGFSHWMLKFDGVSDTQFGVSSGYGRVEMAYYLMARDAGIDMMESRLLEEHGRAHFMTQRFDRIQGQKLHVQTFCALRHFDFNEVDMYSYEALFETMRMLGLTYPEAQQMFRRMAFNVMARNCDDHTKNFAFIMQPSGQWRLSPAYDVCHAYRPGSHWVSQHALSINGKRNNIQRNDLLTVGRNMNIKNAAQLIDNIAAVVANWQGYAQKTAVEQDLSDAIAATHVLL